MVKQFAFQFTPLVRYFGPENDLASPSEKGQSISPFTDFHAQFVEGLKCLPNLHNRELSSIISLRYSHTRWGISPRALASSFSVK